jgi:hypothetical protein
MSGGQYATSVVATSSGGGVVFVRCDAPGIPLRATSVLTINDGSSSAVYFDYTTTGGATTGAWPLRAGESASIWAKQGFYSGLSYTTTAGGAVSVSCRVLATR